MNKDSNELLDDQLHLKLKTNKFSIVFCVLAVTLIGLGELFRIRHWAFSNILLLLGTGSLTGYLIAKSLFFSKRLHSIIASSIALCIILLLLIRYQHFLGFFLTYLGVSLLGFLFYYLRGIGIKKYNAKVKSEEI